MHNPSVVCRNPPTCSEESSTYGPHFSGSSEKSDWRKVCSLLKTNSSSGRIRTYNPSVNSRTAYSCLALQTQDLDARKADFPRIWGDFGGTLPTLLPTLLRASLQKAGFTAPILHAGAHAARPWHTAGLRNT